jgi:tRNA A37 methylthiotransferase MiaB
VFGGDIIAGFPTETGEMFTRSLDLVEECGLTFLHVFHSRPGRGRPPHACRKSRMRPLKSAPAPAQLGKMTLVAISTARSAVIAAC